MGLSGGLGTPRSGDPAGPTLPPRYFEDSEWTGIQEFFALKEIGKGKYVLDEPCTPSFSMLGCGAGPARGALCRSPPPPCSALVPAAAPAPRSSGTRDALRSRVHSFESCSTGL